MKMSNQPIQVNLDDLIIPTFRSTIAEFIDCTVDRIVLKGGRNSTKSQVISEAIITGVMSYKQSAVALIKYSNKIEDRLVNTFKESIRFLGVEDWWKLRRSPFEYVLLDKPGGKETQVSIKFSGADDPDMLKSFKPRQGSFRYIWFEELTNFLSKKEVDSIIITMARGKGKRSIAMSYNPPQSTSHWTNKEYNCPIGKILGNKSNQYREEFEFSILGEKHKTTRIIHHSTYHDVVNSGHADWLGTVFLSDAENLKSFNKKMYDWTYLGTVVGTDANVFRNIVELDEIVMSDYNTINRGLDFSNGGSDPHFYIETAFDPKQRTLTILNEFSDNCSIEQLSRGIKSLNKNNFPVYSDGAVPTFTAQLVGLGLVVTPAKKRSDSVRSGIQWLKNLNAIYICKLRTPKAFKEFSEYEYVVTREDVVTTELKDKNNHSIDSVRYGNVYNITDMQGGD